jgi:hypothetical protein
MFPKNPEAELGLIRSNRDTAGGLRDCNARAGRLHSRWHYSDCTARAEGDDLRGYPLSPIHQAVKANLR